MNIVLTSIHITNSPDAIPLAPALLKGNLLKELPNSNLTISILETTLNDSMDYFIKELLNRQPDVIGLSIYLWNREYYLSLVKKIKKVNKDVIIIAGGPEIRSGYKSLLDNNIDYTIQGEGEEVICELISALQNNNDPLLINGINDDVNRFIKTLDNIPSPLIEQNIELNKYDGYLWELSRGCPYSCDFCFESRGSKGVRYYSFERIEKELNIIIENNTAQVFVLDPTFNKDLNRAKKILKLIKKNNRGTHFHFEIRAELLDRELSQLFADIGASLQIGIQSSNDDILRLINRRIDKNQFKSKVSLLNDVGAIFGLDLIYGLPGDSYRGFKDSMEYVLSLQPNHLDIFPLAVLPGTALWDNSQKLNLRYNINTPYTVIQSPSYTIEDMDKSRILKESCDLIYNRGKSTGWLIQVCNELNTSLTDFIEGFNPWFLDSKFNSKTNELVLIKSYINNNFKPKRFNLIEDMINYHSAYSKALLEEKKVTKIPRNEIMDSIPRLSLTASLLNFSYPILDAIDNGDYTINSIKKLYRENRNKSISWFHSGGEVVFDSYTNKIMKFLNKIDNKLSCKDIDNNIDIDFLLFAQESGMIHFT